MAGFLIMAIIGTIYIFGYHIFGGADAPLYFGIAFVLIGFAGALIEDFLLTKELKSLRKFFRVSAEAVIKTNHNGGKTIEQIYKEEKDNEKEINK